MKNNNSKTIWFIVIFVVVICCVLVLGVFIGKNYFSESKSDKQESADTNVVENHEPDEQDDTTTQDDSFDRDEILILHQYVAVPMLTRDYDVSNMSLADKVFMVMKSLSPDTQNSEDTPKHIYSDEEAMATLCDGAFSGDLVLKTLKMVYPESNISFDELDNIKIYGTENYKYYSDFYVYNKQKDTFSYYGKPLDVPMECSSVSQVSRNSVQSVEQIDHNVVVNSICNHCEGYNRQYTFQKINGKFYFKSVKVLS